MLTTLPRRCPVRSGFSLLGALALLTGLTSGLLTGEPTRAQPSAMGRPEGLVVLEERLRTEGMVVLGVYGPKPVPDVPGLWRAQLWRQIDAAVTIQTDTLRCTPAEPMRMTGQAGRLLIRSLNPGGPITPANRVDHLVWWAVCHPEHAGQDPEGLAAVARRLGYSTTLRESEQVLPGRAP